MFYFEFLKKKFVEKSKINAKPLDTLEAENIKLKKMLNVERKALFDEEIVRQLATRFFVLKIY